MFINLIEFNKSLKKAKIKLPVKKPILNLNSPEYFGRS